MGADGHIHIWNDEKVREAFPDCDELFSYLPSHYHDELDGILYHHCYFGDNIWAEYSDPDDWYLPNEWNKERTEQEEAERLKIKARLVPFVKWLEDNATHWEVWT